MDDIEGMVFGMWLFVTARRKVLFQMRLEAVRRSAAEKYRRVLEILQSSDNETSRVAQRRKKVFTSLRPWSVCDRCGAAGEQVRVGLCYVHSDFLHVRYRRANQTVASCGSGAVPRAFGLQGKSRAGAKLEVRSCQVTCPAEAPPSTELLTLITFLGYSSTSLPVFYVNHPADQVLTLGCPRALPNMVVAWDRGSEPIYRSKHLAGSNISSMAPRVLIDTGHHLVFKPAKSQDSGVYYCWLQGRRTAEIRVLVFVHLGRGQSVTSHPEFRTAVNTVLKSYAAMTAMFCLLLVGRAGVRLLRDSPPTHVD
ncbi:hypothetical protein INR49_023166 [Caranx melampygus]|nr:hypothetical protein INR49_023166 [Caranx melampygus]